MNDHLPPTAAGARGIADSAMHAERDYPGWVDDAAFELAAYAQRGGVFTIEEARAAADVPEPEELRAWGAATKQAIRRGWIVPTGQFRSSHSSNNQPMRLYRAPQTEPETMIHEVTVTISVPSDRLAELADFLLERTPTAARLLPPPGVSPVDGSDAGGERDVEAKPEKPKKPKRTSSKKVEPKVEPDGVALVNDDTLSDGSDERDEPAVSEDDLRAAIKTAVVNGGIAQVTAALAAVGAASVSEIKAGDRATVLAALKA